MPQRIAGLEHREQELREEVVQSNQLRKQQLVELGLLREEEKQKMQRDNEAEVCMETKWSHSYLRLGNFRISH